MTNTEDLASYVAARKPLNRDGVLSRLHRAHGLGKGATVLATLTGETGTVTWVSPEGAIDVDFPDGTNCHLLLSEYRVINEAS